MKRELLFSALITTLTGYKFVSFIQRQNQLSRSGPTTLSLSKFHLLQFYHRTTLIQERHHGLKSYLFVCLLTYAWFKPLGRKEWAFCDIPIPYRKCLQLNNDCCEIFPTSCLSVTSIDLLSAVRTMLTKMFNNTKYKVDYELSNVSSTKGGSEREILLLKLTIGLAL